MIVGRKRKMKRIAVILYTGFYLLLTVGFLLLAVLARRETLPAYARDPPLLRPVRRMAAWLYRTMDSYRQKRRGSGKAFHVPGEERVRQDLLVLYPSLKARRREVRFQISKIERILLLLFAWILLAGGLHIHALRAHLLQENGQVERAETGGADRRLRVTALPLPEEAAEGTTEYGTYTVTVHARRYTRQEAETLAQEILSSFPDRILGGNPSPEQIREPLSMPQAEELTPFTASWESSRYAVLDTDGTVFNEEYKEEQAEEVDLTLTLTYAGYSFQKQMPLVVRAPVRNEEENLREKIRNALLISEEKSADSKHYTLPETAAGRRLTWREQAEDISASVLLFGVFLCAAVWMMTDSRLHEKTKERSRQMAIDYPQFISRIVLYLGAGMSVRSIFYKCAAEYEAEQRTDPAGAEYGADRKQGSNNPGRYLYEEILLVRNELESGISEAEAYMHFGRRCRSRQYTKLASLLVQNLRRGNDTLLQVLQEEAADSFEERKNLARELGEEAGTKLLLPMMIMLGVTMLIIIVPAYFSFSM